MLCDQNVETSFVLVCSQQMRFQHFDLHNILPRFISQNSHIWTVKLKMNLETLRCLFRNGRSLSNHWEKLIDKRKHHSFSVIKHFPTCKGFVIRNKLILTLVHSRECVRAGAAGSRTRRSSGHHALNPQNFEWTRRILLVQAKRNWF